PRPRPRPAGRCPSDAPTGALSGPEARWPGPRSGALHSSDAPNRDHDRCDAGQGREDLLGLLPGRDVGFLGNPHQVAGVQGADVAREQRLAGDRPRDPDLALPRTIRVSAGRTNVVGNPLAADEIQDPGTADFTVHADRRYQ